MKRPLRPADDLRHHRPQLQERADHREALPRAQPPARRQRHRPAGAAGPQGRAGGMKNDRRRAFTAGYGCAIANVARDYMEEQIAWFMLRDSGMQIADFRLSGLDPYDLEVIERLFESNAADAEMSLSRLTSDPTAAAAGRARSADRYARDGASSPSSPAGPRPGGRTRRRPPRSCRGARR